MRRLLVIVVSAVLLGAGCAGDDAMPLTSVLDVIGGRVADGSVVTVRGTVISQTALPAASAVSYRLAADDASIVIVAPEGAGTPQIAEEVEVTGVVRVAYVIDVPGEEPEEFGTVIEETRRTQVVDAQVQPSDLWTWAGGIAGVVILGWLVAWAAIRRSSGTSEAEMAECRGCQGAVQTDWISCPWCGIKLDAKPPSPATMIVAPLGADDGGEALAPASAGATVIIPPEDDGR